MESAAAGYWRGVSNETYTLRFTDEKGERALLECTGEITWDKQGRITKGETGFLRIKTAAKIHEWYKITATELKDGLLSITTEPRGTYTFFAKAKVNSASARSTLKASITADKVWNGQASFILSNFSPSFDDSGRIAMDTRNYKISDAQTVTKVTDKATSTTGSVDKSRK